MKKLSFFVLGLLIIIGIIFVLRGNEDTWMCDNGEWIKHGQPSAPKPTDPCGQEDKKVKEVDDEANLDEVKQIENKSNGVLDIIEKVKDTNISGGTLDMSNQGLKTLSTEFFENKTNIEIFNLSYNMFTGALPAEIRKMSNLKELRASHNKLTGIPAEIGQLNKLEILDFSYNDIDTMPNEIVNLADTLKELILTGNRYSPEQIEAFQVLLPNSNIIYD